MVRPGLRPGDLVALVSGPGEDAVEGPGRCRGQQARMLQDSHLDPAAPALLQTPGVKGEAAAFIL